MLVEIDRFVNWLRRRNPDARTWRDYHYDPKQFAATVGDRPPVVATMTSGSPPPTSNTYSVVTPSTVCAVRLREPLYSKLLTTPPTFALTRRLAASQVYTLVPWIRKLPRQSPK
jgi:hypothetical protein